MLAIYLSQYCCSFSDWLKDIIKIFQSYQSFWWPTIYPPFWQLQLSHFIFNLSQQCPWNILWANLTLPRQQYWGSSNSGSRLKYLWVVSWLLSATLWEVCGLNYACFSSLHLPYLCRSPASCLMVNAGLFVVHKIYSTCHLWLLYCCSTVPPMLLTHCTLHPFHCALHTE